MAPGGVGINRVGGIAGLPSELEALKSGGADFVELWVGELGVIRGGNLDEARLRPVRESLLDADLAYTVHSPIELNLMQLAGADLHRDVLATSIRFAGEIGAKVVVCHAGQRSWSRDARVSFKDQLAAERYALREAGDLAADLGVSIAVENYYPDMSVLSGAVYDYSVRPSELADQVSGVDHPSIGVCLDVGHAALAANAFGFDLIEECAAVSPLVRHLHLHDNLGRTDLDVDPLSYGNPVYGIGDLHLPPGSGSIPLEDLFRRVDFPRDPARCVELAPELVSETREALNAARRLTTRERVIS
ncbi:MAG TPA: sugar phosphate isomerase/epimerase family protein [Rubrobacteraceae bacterium]|nr:sugar phosphate isomerase/epimerase family protein [Rubrobacteraceae bacterium]